MTWNLRSLLSPSKIVLFSLYESDHQAKRFNYPIKGELHFILGTCDSNRLTLQRKDPRNGQGNVM